MRLHDLHGSIVMERDECLARLGERSVGRLVVVRGGRPLIFPVSYALVGDEVVIKTNPGTKLNAALRSPVAFEVDEVDEERRWGWSVIVHGRAEEVTAADAPELHASADAVLDPMADHKTRVVRIVPGLVTGRRIGRSAMSERTTRTAPPAATLPTAPAPPRQPTEQRITRVLVPLELTDEAERAVVPARRLAQRLDCPVTLFGWHWDLGEVAAARIHLERLLVDMAVTGDVRVVCTGARSPAPAIVSAAADRPGTLVCMATHARGGVAHTVLGSVAEAVLRATGSPVLLVGPSIDDGAPAGGPVLACLDGSDAAESILPVAEALARQLGTGVELVTVADVSPGPEGRVDGDALESSYLSRVAADHDVVTSWEVLHGARPEQAIAAHARGRAAVVVAGTHGRTGLARLLAGSVAIGIVHRSPSPVLVVPVQDEGA